MYKITDTQWRDSTVNPIMGCSGCELFPPPSQVLTVIVQAVAETGETISSKQIFKKLVNDAFQRIKTPQPGHKQAVNTANIWHLRHLFLERVRQDIGGIAADAAESAIRKAITCYAATLHRNKGANILKPDYVPKAGYAPIFEAVSTFGGRMEDAANWQDLLGQENPASPWKAGLPRMIFVSDMGDALSAKRDFPFLNREAVPAFESENGMRHLWLWLTKRPGTMAEFAKGIGGFPENVCAMTTLTRPATIRLRTGEEPGSGAFWLRRPPRGEASRRNSKPSATLTRSSPTSTSTTRSRLSRIRWSRPAATR